MVFSFQMSTNFKKALISYISIVIGVVFYYLEVGNQLFFTLYKPGSNFAPILFAYHKSMSFYFLGYLAILAPIFIFYLKTHLNIIYRILIYFLIPSIFSMVMWYFDITLQLPLKAYNVTTSKLDYILYFISQSYLVGMTFFITIIASICDLVLNIFIKKN